MFGKKLILIGVLSDIEVKQPELRELIEEAKKLIIEDHLPQAYRIVSYKIIPNLKYYKDDLIKAWDRWVEG
jgi:hypothetical protein